MKSASSKELNINNFKGRYSPKNKSEKRTPHQIILFVILIVLGFIMFIPFLWSIVASFTPKTALEGSGFKLWYGEFTWSNWAALGSDSSRNWFEYIGNTLVIAFSEIFLQLFFCSMSAYVFAKYDFYGKNILYKIFLVSMMLPGIITLIPQFIVVTHMPLIGGNNIIGEDSGNWWETLLGQVGPGLYNSLFAVILPNAVSIYGILFLRQFFTNLSDEIGDAARVDGASEFKIYKIYLKMAIPGITTLGLFTFVSTWNSYLWPSLVLFDRLTLGVALNEYQTSASTGEMMAGSLISIIPIIVLFLFTQKYFMKQQTYTGIK